MSVENNEELAGRAIECSLARRWLERVGLEAPGPAPEHERR